MSLSPRARRRPALAVLLLVSAAHAACGSDAQSAPNGAPNDAKSASGAPAPAGTQAAQDAPGAAPAAAPATASAPAQPPRAKGPQPSRAAADAMSVSELVSRRDLWPTTVAFTQMVRLDETTWWKAGDELPLANWDGANAYLDEGSFMFDLPATMTDVEARARDVAASMSAEQLALTVSALIQRPELWPQRLTITTRLEFGSNAVVSPGRQVALRFFEGEQLSVYDRELENYYLVAPNETDLMAQARARMALPESERAPFFIRSLEAALEPRADGGAVALKDADFVLVYVGRLQCPRCSAFAPQLKEFYAQAQAGAPQGRRFELVMLSQDPDADSARAWVAKAGLPGGVIAFDRRLEAANLMALPLQMLPGFFVFDRAGNVVARNDPNAGQPSADQVLAQFAARVKG